MARSVSTDETVADEIDLTPDNGSVNFSGGLDEGELRLNFSDEEAGSEARSFEPIPMGKYHVKITECEVARCGPDSKNPGKPYYKITCVIQDGKFALRKLWTNAMLFEGALYTISQLMKAMGRTPGRDPIPTIDELLTLDVIAVVKKVVDKYKIKQGEWDAASGDPKPMKNEIGGFAAYRVSSTSGSGELMP